MTGFVYLFSKAVKASFSEPFIIFAIAGMLSTVNAEKAQFLNLISESEA